MQTGPSAHAGVQSTAGRHRTTSAQRNGRCRALRSASHANSLRLTENYGLYPGLPMPVVDETSAVSRGTMLGSSPLYGTQVLENPLPPK